MTLIALDLESTGLDPEMHEWWELAAIVREHPVGEYNGTWVWQRRPHLASAQIPALMINGYYERRATVSFGAVKTMIYPPNAFQGPTRLNGTPEDRTEEDHASLFAHMISGATIVGSNPAFDMGFIAAYLHEYDQAVAVNYHLVDVRALVYGFIRGRDVHSDTHTAVTWDSSTGALAFQIGIDQKPEDKHTALGDARFALDCWDQVNAK